MSSAIAAAAGMLVAGCGGSYYVSVRYDEGILIVYNTRYPRVPPYVAQYQPGIVIAEAEPGQMNEAALMLDDLDLRVLSRNDANLTFVVQVPVGYEEQWRRALIDQPSIRMAYLSAPY
ncbi:hypothetical protein GCM10027343_20940 [Noviherbaspirillum agri]